MTIQNLFDACPSENRKTKFISWEYNSLFQRIGNDLFTNLLEGSRLFFSEPESVLNRVLMPELVNTFIM